MGIEITDRLRDTIHTDPSTPKLTIYLSVGDSPRAIEELRSELRCMVEEAKAYLKRRLPPLQIETFLRPVREFATPGRLIGQPGYSIGIFRSQETFRVLTLPFEVDRLCVVANSYHVKPLIKWARLDSRFFLLGVDSEGASLYRGSLASFQSVDRALFPAKVTDGLAKRDYRPLRETLSWIDEWLRAYVTNTDTPMYLVGNREVLKEVSDELGYSSIDRTPLAFSFRKERAAEYCEDARKRIKARYLREVESALIEYFHAQDRKLTLGTLQQIARSAAEGRIKKLFVAEDVRFWGRMDRTTGKVQLHPMQLNSEDDDLLDDLAELVLSRGGEVVVGKLEQLPYGRPVSAILTDQQQSAAARKERPRATEGLAV